tara:strand:- start:3644 stop:5365 length:1722 start_codon:yes stop_codon:yes gene_type:complete
MNDFDNKLEFYLKSIYKDSEDINEISQEIKSILITADNSSIEKPRWTQEDIFLISYADTIRNNSEPPLKSLKDFLDDHIEGINSIHILPFMPSSSDYGFSVIDYYSIDPKNGSWKELRDISNSFNLMMDIVLNHSSIQSGWFKNYINGSGKGSDYFIEVGNWSGIPQVVRPRTSELFQKFETKNGDKLVWCTFSRDQVDLNFKNPKVLIEFIKIFSFYIKKGIRIFRLDAVAYIWKEENTNCINRPETHSIVKILRLIIERMDNRAILITETNVPNTENLAYFGESNEAHWIYNFTLSPLILYTLLRGNCSILRKWSMTMPPAKNGNAYFNFLASHDGIGLRPIEGYINKNELTSLLNLMKSFGGEISYRTSQWGDKNPYEINISFLDSLRGTFEGVDNFMFDRFICAHTIMFSFEGVPAIYIHSLLGTRNDYESIKKGKENRSINRFKWEKNKIYKLLSNSKSLNAKILSRIKQILKIRIKQPAFHPNSTQFTLNLGNRTFGLWRQDADRTQSIFCITNITKSSDSISLSEINLIETEDWFDLLTSKKLKGINDRITMKPYQTLWITNKLTI